MVFQVGRGVRQAPARAGISAEMESHLQLHIDDNVRAGMTPAQAQREAMMKLGGLEQTKEAPRPQRLAIPRNSLTRYSLRLVVSFAKMPGLHRCRRLNSIDRHRSQRRHLQRPRIAVVAAAPLPDSERLVDAHVVLRENHHQWGVLTNANIALGANGATPSPISALTIIRRIAISPPEALQNAFK